jgi:hypothetical protein
MNEKLAGAGFGQPHEVFDFQVVIELGLSHASEESWRGR